MLMLMTFLMTLTMVMMIIMMMMTMVKLEELVSTKGKSQLVQSSMAKHPSWSIYDNDGDGPSLMVMVIQWK